MAPREIVIHRTLLAALLLLLVATTASAATYVVTKTSDDDGPCTVDDCALREAILAANVEFSEQDLIIVPGGTYQLALPGPDEQAGRTGDLNIDTDFVEVRGDPADPAVIIGDGSDRVLQISGALITLSNLVITGGNVEGPGGGIFLLGVLASLDRVTVHGNRATTDGGGILVATGEVEISDSLLSDNETSRYGGGIAAHGGVGLLEVVYMRVRNSTISSNHAELGGGGIYLGDRTGALVSHGTIVENVAPTGRVLLTSRNGIQFRNSLLIGDCAAEHSFDRENTNGGNVESPGNTCFSHPVGDLINVADPGLGPLGDHGGPTWTHSLLLDSPAIDRAVAADCILTDQRGAPRPRDGDGDGIARCDAGSYEVSPTLGVPEIPALSRSGLAMLVLVIAAVGWRRSVAARSRPATP